MKLKNGKVVERYKIPEYFNDYYYSCLQLYNRYMSYGLPWSGGWAENPAYILDIIDAFKGAEVKCEKKIDKGILK